MLRDSSGKTLFRTEYGYRDLSDTQTTAQLETHITYTASGALIGGYKYAYDALGNITEIRQGTGSNYLLVAYTYD